MPPLQRPEASIQKIGKNAKERAEIEQMAEAVTRYTGPIRYCPPSIARGHEALATLALNRASRAALSAANERREQTTSQLAR